MKPIKGYNAAQASGDFERLAAGGYVIRINGVENNEDKQYLKIVYDIAEGPERGRYKEIDPKDNNANWRCSFVRSYKESALGMFKAFIKAVDESNETNFNDFIEKGFDEQHLKGCRLGVLFGYEEYEANDGNVKERLRLVRFLTIEQVRAGDFRIPELKKLAGSDIKPTSAPPAGFTPLNDADAPF